MNRRTLLISTAIVAAAAGAGVYGFRRLQATKAPKRRFRRQTAVQVAVAAREDVSTTLSVLGTVTASLTANVVSKVQGHLTEVLFKEGDYVKKGQLLATVDTKPYEANLAQYRGTLAQAQANLANAKTILARYERLYKQDSISRQNLETQRASVAMYEGSVKSAKGQIESASVSIGYGRITAPISGFIGIRGRDIGNLVGPSDSTPIGVITQTSPASIEFSVPQANIAEIVAPVRAGKKMPVQIYDQGGGAMIAQGAIAAVGNQIDASTGTVKVKAEVPNEDNMLFPNQFVNVTIVTGVIENAVVVPNAAVQTGTSGDFVFTVDDQSVAKKVPVKIGPSRGGKTVIVSGLSGGERVITTGADSVGSGSVVTVVTPKEVDMSVLDKPKAPRGMRGRAMGPADEGGASRPARSPAAAGGSAEGGRQAGTRRRPDGNGGGAAPSQP